MSERRYWGFRMDRRVMNELKEGKLRQGWGWDPRQDLRKWHNEDKDAMNDGARRNLSMFYGVKKGDVLLINHIPEWHQIAIVEATEDWNKGYRFEIHQELGDFGHIFPAKKIKVFNKHNRNVEGGIHSTFKCRSRFWNIDRCAENIENILKLRDENLVETEDRDKEYEDIVKGTFKDVFDEETFKGELYKKLKNKFNAAQWEHVLVHGLEVNYPDYLVERTGGKKEAHHGTDILIRLPSPIDIEEYYGIAIQVKDYEQISEGGIKGVIEQIGKVDSYDGFENTKIIERVIVLTGVDGEVNSDFENVKAQVEETGKDIKLLTKKEVQKLLYTLCNNIISFKDPE